MIDLYNDPYKVIPTGINRDSLFMKPLGLTAQEKADLENFLLALTDKRLLVTAKPLKNETELVLFRLALAYLVNLNGLIMPFLMNNPIRLGFFLSILAFSGPLFAQAITPNFSSPPPSPMVDSLARQKPTASTQKHNLLKINPLGLLAGQLSLFYERSLTRHTALVIGYGVGSNKGNFGHRLEPGGAAYRRVTLEVRRYWMPNRLTGFYAGPYVRWSRLTVSQFVYDQQGEAIRDSQGIRLTNQQQNTIWIPGLLAGGQLIARWFCLDGFVGVQRQLVVGPAVRGNQLVEGMTAPWAFRFGLSVGLAF